MARGHRVLDASLVPRLSRIAIGICWHGSRGGAVISWVKCTWAERPHDIDATRVHAEQGGGIKLLPRAGFGCQPINSKIRFRGRGHGYIIFMFYRSRRRAVTGTRALVPLRNSCGDSSTLTPPSRRMSASAERPARFPNFHHQAVMLVRTLGRSMTPYTWLTG